MSSPPSSSSGSAIRLYSYAMSPYAAKVHCFLLFKRLEFECFYINPLHVKRDLPIGHQIPVLSVNGESRADSTPIGLWLDERFPESPPLLPVQGAEREHLLAVDDWISNHLIPGSFCSYPGSGINRVLNGWKLSRVMANTSQGGLPFALRAAWPLIIKRIGFVRKLLAMTDNGPPVREAKLKLYGEFLAHLKGGAFVAGRDTPSLPDLSAYPQFALYWMTGFRGAEDILEYPDLMAWLGRMKPYVTGVPDLVPAIVRKRDNP